MEKRRPNVIVVLSDQQRWDTTGAHGNPLDPTPQYDRMARYGTHAELAFSPQPVCAPARAAIQTGQYPTTTGCFRNGIALPPDSPTLARHFGKAGYHTGYIGKWHLADTDPVPQSQRGGYDSWLASNLLEFSSDAYRTIMHDEDATPVLLPGYRSDACVDAAIRYVSDHHDEPFFLFLSLLEPHHQNETDAYPAPEGYEQRYQGRWLPPDLAGPNGAGGTADRHMGGYLGQVARVDEGLGRLRDALGSLDLLDDTIVAYTSDHGCHFKTRNSEYKRSAHDSSIRVPLAITGPGFDVGRNLNRPVSTLDLPPTLLDAAGIKVPDDMQGQSFLPLVSDPQAEFPQEAYIQVSESACGRAIRTSRWLYYVAAPEANPWTESVASGYVETELYDLKHDPYQLNNLAGYPSHHSIAAELRERLIQRIARAGEPVPQVTPAPAVRANSQRRVDPAAHSIAAEPLRFGTRSHGGLMRPM